LNRLDRIENIKSVLEFRKAEDVISFDMKDSDYIFDYVIIATTLNGKHALSTIDYLKDEFKPQGEEFLNIDENSDWTAVDLGDIVIHLMSQEYRNRYNIEELCSIILK